MKANKYVVYKEGEYFVSQCLNYHLQKLRSFIRQSGLTQEDFDIKTK